MSVRAPRPSHVALPALAQPPSTILAFLCARFPGIDRPRWEDRLRRGLVSVVGGTLVEAHTPYREGLRVVYFREVDSEPEPQEEAVLLHVDDAFAIADKPHGMPVVPSGAYVSRALIYRVAQTLADPDLVSAHRLDRDTAGLVLLVRRAADRASFHRLFASRKVQKAYRAIARGDAPDTRYWRVRSRIVSGTPRFRRRSIPDRAGDAISDVYVDGSGEGTVNFWIRPETGKQHQVRLHLAQIGFPILGDTLYPELRHRDPAGPPLQLLAQEISFRDPTTGRTHHFSSRRRLQLAP